jgi:ubiquinone/menaquinone biosynthesis C-methylase UbiE
MKYPPSDSYQKNLDKYYQYKKARISGSLRYFHRQRLDVIATMVNNINQKESGSYMILDAGCGRGANTIRFAQKGIQVIGIDISEEALKQANRWVNEELLQDRVTLVQGDILALPFKNESFDAIISSDVLSTVSGVDKGIDVMAGLLKKGGVAIIAFPNSISLFWSSIFILQKLANILRMKMPEGNKFDRFYYRDFKSRVNRSGLKIKGISSVYVIPMLHLNIYNQIEAKVRFKFPFKYLGSHIIIEAIK